jgi:hypothetical protein
MFLTRLFTRLFTRFFTRLQRPHPAPNPRICLVAPGLGGIDGTPSVRARARAYPRRLELFRALSDGSGSARSGARIDWEMCEAASRAVPCFGINGGVAHDWSVMEFGLVISPGVPLHDLDTS